MLCCTVSLLGPVIMMLGGGLPDALHSIDTFLVSLTVRGVSVNWFIFAGTRKVLKIALKLKVLGKKAKSG